MRGLKWLLVAYLALTADAFAECASFWDFSQLDEAGDSDRPFLFGGGPVDGLAAVAQSLVSIGAGTDNNNATAKYTVSTSVAEPLPPLGSTKWITGCNHALSISLSSPIDKSDNITDLATLDGLANAFTFTVSYSQYIDRIRRSGDGNTEGELDAWGFFWGGTATLGRESFDYVDLDDFDKQSNNERPWAISLFIGRDFGQWTVTGRLKLEESYKNQDDITRCRPIVGSTDLDCRSGPLGPPNEENGRQASVEVRHQIGDSFGIAPAVHHDFEKDVTGINLPIFLWQDDKGQLTGGIRVGWRDDTDSTEFGLFVSQPL